MSTTAKKRGGFLDAVGRCFNSVMMPIRIYSTNKEVKLLDRKLGILYFSITSLVFAYVIGVRCIYEKGYNVVERSYGVVGISINGSTYATTNGIAQPADVASLVQIGPEGSSVFLPTKWITWVDQKRGNCTSPDTECKIDQDCPTTPHIAGGKCEDGHCESRQWCVPGDDGFYTGPTAPKDPFARGQEKAVAAAGGFTELQALDAIDRPGLVVVLQASISFKRGFLSLKTETGKARVKWTLAQVLQRAGLTAAQAVEQGGVLSVVLKWDCPNLLSTDDCLPNLQVTQLAPGMPVYRQWANYYRRTADPSIPYRELYQARGLRLLVTSRGVGEEVSLEMITLQLFVLLALMPIASTLADTIMMHFFAERRHYREYKTEHSPDFSDVRSKVEQLEKQSKKNQFKQMEYA